MSEHNVGNNSISFRTSMELDQYTTKLQNPSSLSSNHFQHDAGLIAEKERTKCKKIKRWRYIMLKCCFLYEN